MLVFKSNSPFVFMYGMYISTWSETNINLEVKKQSKIRCAVVWKSDGETEKIHLNR